MKIAISAMPNSNYNAYLKHLGEHVRSLRVRRGMTRKLLSKNSNVSERYLAKLEQGEGNISILLLKKVADAMNLPVAELLCEDRRRSAEFTLALNLLENLLPPQQQEAYALLSEKFDSSNDKTGIVALIGLRGAGKTTLGRGLAQHFGMPFVHLGTEIEKLAGMPLAEIFSLAGQTRYRLLELQALTNVLKRRKRAVLEVGGSIVVELRTYNFLLNSCYTIWLRASPTEHMARVMAQGDMRPMAGNETAMNDLEQMLAERKIFYSKANAKIDTTNRSPDEVMIDLITCCETIFR